MDKDVMAMPMKDWENVKARYQELVDTALELQKENVRLTLENKKLKETIDGLSLRFDIEEEDERR